MDIIIIIMNGVVIQFVGKLKSLSAWPPAGPVNSWRTCAQGLLRGYWPAKRLGPVLLHVPY